MKAGVETEKKGVPINASFQMNHSYHDVITNKFKKNQVMIKNSADCVSYVAEIDSNGHPPYHPGFKNCAQRADTVEKARDCIELFGTHYIRKIEMGSKFGM